MRYGDCSVPVSLTGLVDAMAAALLRYTGLAGE